MPACPRDWLGGEGELNEGARPGEENRQVEAAGILARGAFAEGHVINLKGAVNKKVWLKTLTLNFYFSFCILTILYKIVYFILNTYIKNKT